MHSKAAPRRRHGAELKAQVLAECERPGASVAAVAQLHGLNANLVHKWRRQQRARSLEAATVDDKLPGAFIPLALPPQIAPAAADIRIELRRGATTMNIAWPGVAAGECAAWLREWLR
ncbi:MAG TPA: transposase [Burkholderiaceae bacterium]|nr:transposase [Burkholderiaceae bacterium]